MIKIGLVQIQVYPGEICENAKQILRYITQYKNQVDLFVFPELCLTGYLIGDLWEFEDFLKESEYWQKKIIEASISTSIIFGNIQIDWSKNGEDGKPRKYNGVVFAQNGKIIKHPKTNLSYSIKTLQPNYREFDDDRHFYSLQKWCRDSKIPLKEALSPFRVKIKKQSFSIGLSLCEDGWDDYYVEKPLDILVSNSVDFLINISCSPFTISKEKKRDRIFQNQSQKRNKVIVYSNCVGIQNNGKNIYTFDGNSTVYFPQKKYLKKQKPYEKGVFIVECDFKTMKASSISNNLLEEKGSQESDTETISIFQALSYGASHFLKQLNINKIVIGISGGIDSAVCAALYRQILSPENILLVSMPGPYTSKLTRSLSRSLAKNLGCYFMEVSIKESVQLTQKQLQNQQIFSVDGSLNQTLDLTSFHLENVQARDRSSRILSALSSAFGGVFTCNSNKVEMTVGYSTLYGDLSGFLALIADLWKKQVYDLAEYLNSVVYKFKVIPQGIIDIVPSAELNAEQDVERGLGDPLIYQYHDCLLRSWIQGHHRFTPANILSYYQKDLLQEKLNCSVDPSSLFNNVKEFINDLEKWWNLYQGMGVSKRIQSPPILSISSRSLGYDHRESILKPFYSREYNLLKKELLKKR